MAIPQYSQCNLLMLRKGQQNCSDTMDNRKRLINIQRLPEQLTKAVYEKCWDESHGYLADTPAKKEFSMHAQIFGVLTNTIPENDQKAFVQRFMNDKSLIQPTMYFRFYLTQGFEKNRIGRSLS